MDDIRRRDFLVLGTSLVAGVQQAVALGASAKVAGADRTTAGQQTSPFRLEFKDNVLRFAGDWCEIPVWTMALDVDNELLQTMAAIAEHISEEPLHVKFHFPQRELTWEVVGEIDQAANTLILRSSIRNESQRPIALGKAFLLRTNGLIGFFEPGDEVVYLPITSGEQAQQLKQVQKLDAKGATSGIAMQAFNQSQSKALQAGFVTFQRAKTMVEHARQASALQLKVWCEFDRWELDPGASTSTETLILGIGKNPHAQLEAWGDRAARLCNPRVRKWKGEAHGWNGCTWVDAYNVERYEDFVLRNARAIRRRLAGFPLEYIWISIGNLKDGQPGDWLSWNEKNFPSGHNYLNSQLQELGFKWGLWCGAFMLSSKLQDKVEELRDALFKKLDGKQPMVQSDDFTFGLDNPSDHSPTPVYALDPSHPKTLEFLGTVFRTYREWGVRHFVIDSVVAGADTLCAIPHAKHYDKKLVSGPEVLQKGLRAIREACGDDTHLVACSGPTIETTGIADSVRVGIDFGEGRPLTRDFDEYPGTFMINVPANVSNGAIAALSNQASSYYTHRRLYINNSGDLLAVDKPLPLNQAQAFATIHVMSGGPTLLGDDIEAIDEERLNLIKQTLPRPKEVAFPADLFTRKEQGYPRVFHRKVTRPWGSYDVVAVYNFELGRSLDQTVDLKSIGLEESRNYLVWEFWSSDYVGKVRGQLRAQVPLYSVKVFRLTEDTGRPTLLGTDMHVLMGEVEIDRCDWDASRKALSGRAIRPVGEKGSVFLYAPPRVGVANPKGYFLAMDKRDGSLIIRCPLHFDEGWAEWNVKFFNF
jgi:hypothetical protein